LKVPGLHNHHDHHYINSSTGMDCGHPAALPPTPENRKWLFLVRFGIPT
jgi:hypothetical protein